MKANNIIQPKTNDEKASMKKILKFEYPYTFKVRRSLLFLKLNKNHIPDTKIMKGISLIIILGINNEVKINGLNIVTSKFLKNSISSNKLKIIPKQ